MLQSADAGALSASTESNSSPLPSTVNRRNPTVALIMASGYGLAGGK